MMRSCFWIKNVNYTFFITVFFFFRSFFYSDVAEIEASTDLALAEVMYRVAWKYNIKYIFEIEYQ